MLRVSVFLFLTTSAAIAQNSCEDRCTRLKQRSLSRIGYDDERLETLFERQRPLESMKDVCWRLYDNLDCMNKCPKSEKHAVFAKRVRNKCKFVLSETEETLECISKYHSFLTMRCSSFLNEATRLRSESDLSTTPRHDECRFLHLTTICLENHVNSFCKEGRRIFKRLNFRDYFLSFVLPMDDDLFDDEDLDSCQIYDFVKDSEKREKEEVERKQEEERRRRIDDDEDYEEELTTIVNNMEDDSDVTFTSTIPQEPSFVTPEPSTSTSTHSSSSVTPILGTLESIKQEDFTTILDDLLISSEKMDDTTEYQSTDQEQKQEHDGRDDLDNLVNKLDDEGNIIGNEELEEKVGKESQHTTQLPSPSPSSSQTESGIKNQDDTDHNTEYHDYTDHHYDEDYHEDNENITHPTISVVSIESRHSASESEETSTEENEMVEVTTPDQLLNLTPPNEIGKEDDGEEVKIETTTGKRKVFSEDSMENTPPNFFYSSNRYDSTTRSNYVADNLDLQDSEEPLEIDTTTLFGVEGTSRESYDTSTEIVVPVTTELPKRKEGKSKPWLHGGVIVKPILNFDQLDVDQDEAREREERRKQQKTTNTSSSSSSIPTDPSGTTPDDDDDDFIFDSDSPSTNETLIVIGLILLVACLILLILLLLLAYFCSTRSDHYNVHKDEGSPPI